MAITFLPVRKQLDLGLRLSTKEYLTISGTTTNTFWALPSGATYHNYHIGVSGYTGTMGYSDYAGIGNEPATQYFFPHPTIENENILSKIKKWFGRLFTIDLSKITF